MPVAEPAPARHAGATPHLLREPLPLDARLQHEEDAGQARAVRDGAPPALRARAVRRQEGSDQAPEVVRYERRGHTPPPPARPVLLGSLSAFCDCHRATAGEGRHDRGGRAVFSNPERGGRVDGEVRDGRREGCGMCASRSRSGGLEGDEERQDDQVDVTSHGKRDVGEESVMTDSARQRTWAVTSSTSLCAQRLAPHACTGRPPYRASAPYPRAAIRRQSAAHHRGLRARRGLAPLARRRARRLASPDAARA
jgi:hypothetical protein